jgi:galactokinase
MATCGCSGPPYSDPIRSFAPGRVNLIGDHTDYTGGLVLPMAIDRGTTVTGGRGGDRVRLVSDRSPEPVEFRLPLDAAPGRPARGWAGYVQEVARLVAPDTGLVGRITSTLPLGAGLSSSASLEVAVALALGYAGRPVDLARLGQEAEHRASGVPCGIMDQLASAAGVEGHALLIDCSDLTIEPVPVPGEAEIVVVDSGESRRLAGSEYTDRRRACEAAAARIGPLRTATLRDVASLDDPVLEARARHVVTENARVRSFARALSAGDLATCGRLMVESHVSLATDFEVSTERLDRMVDGLVRRPGVHGARLTGAGFGGCVVVLARPGVVTEGWPVRPSQGAYVTD